MSWSPCYPSWHQLPTDTVRHTHTHKEIRVCLISGVIFLSWTSRWKVSSAQMIEYVCRLRGNLPQNSPPPPKSLKADEGPRRYREGSILLQWCFFFVILVPLWIFLQIQEKRIRTCITSTVSGIKIQITMSFHYITEENGKIVSQQINWRGFDVCKRFVFSNQ